MISDRTGPPTLWVPHEDLRVGRLGDVADSLARAKGKHHDECDAPF
jgi:hypothetical protein